MTLSIRKFAANGSARTALLATGLLAGLTGGCYHAPAPRNAPTPPLIIDSAMQQREWSQSAAYYQNGGVKSTPLRTVFTTGPHQSRLLTTGLETAAFVGNAVNLPLTLINHPFNSKVVYQGEVLGPTFNGMPPIAANSASLSAYTQANTSAAAAAPGASH